MQQPGWRAAPPGANQWFAFPRDRPAGVAWPRLDEVQVFGGRYGILDGLTVTYLNCQWVER
jgi:hypothetical protein